MSFTLADVERALRNNQHLRRLNPVVSVVSKHGDSATAGHLAVVLTGNPTHDSAKTTTRRKSQGELEMGAWLQKRLQEGEFHSFEYESITLKVGEPCCRYTPDFAVWRHDGTLLCIEVKGKKKWEDSIIKFKAARKQYPKIEFQMWEISKGNWRELYSETKP